MLNEKMLAVFTSDLAWDHFTLVAHLIERQADAFGYMVFFNHVTKKPDHLHQLVDVIQADRYLISQRVITSCQRTRPLNIVKPVAIIDDIFLKVVDHERVSIPKVVSDRIVRAVRYLCTVEDPHWCR